MVLTPSKQQLRQRELWWEAGLQTSALRYTKRILGTSRWASWSCAYDNALAEAQNLIKVDLGCGTNKAKGSIGVDRSAVPGVDAVGLLDAIPLRQSVADVVYVSHVLEHVPSLINTVEEIWRISKPGAIIHVWSPHASCGFTSWSDPTHVRTLTTNTFDYFSPNSDFNYYSHARFEVLTRELHYTMRREGVPSKSMSPFTAGLKLIIAKIVEPLANYNSLTRGICERIWAPWVGFEEVYFKLVCIK